MKLLEKNNDIVTYAFGYDEQSLDGIIEIHCEDIDKSSVLKLCSSEKVGMIGANKALGKLIRMIQHGKLPEICDYTS